MTLSDDLELIAEHVGDDQPNLPEGAKNTLLLAAGALRKADTAMRVADSLVAANEAKKLAALLAAGFDPDQRQYPRLREHLDAKHKSRQLEGEVRDALGAYRKAAEEASKA